MSHHDEFDSEEDYPSIGGTILPRGQWIAADAPEYRSVGRRDPQFVGQSGDDKPSNPKDSIATNKVPLGLFPPVAIAYGAIGMLEGKLKYGEANFRAVGVRASIYIDAAIRHLESWRDGENLTQDSGCDHLGNALACIAIILDARSIGKLVDDRQIPGNLPQTLKDLEEKVAHLRKLYEDRNPTHYTLDKAFPDAEKVEGL